MAVAVTVSDLDQKTRQEIVNELIVSSKPDFMGYSKGVSIYPYEVVKEDDGKNGTKDVAYFPFHYATQKLKQYPNDKLTFSKRDITFSGQLRPYQLEAVTEAIKLLNQTRTCFLSFATGKGKTLTAVYLASRLKVKACALLYRTVLFPQWEETILDMNPKAKIQTLDSREPIDPDADFYLINPINVMKRPRSDFKDIGFLIADEAHALCSEKLSKSFIHFTPKWCIGLSATPERSDELDRLIDLHFGVTHIHVPLYVVHDYYRLNTQLVPVTKLNVRGHTDWGSVLEFQASHPGRNVLIVKLCLLFKDRNILVLGRRVAQVKTLYQMLSDEKESVDYTTGTKKTFNKDARILLSTTSKSGVGFNHPKLDMLIIASDVEEMFEQYFGRVVRREDVCPIVVDLVDDLKSLDRHYGTRKAFSIKVGGRIKDFRLSFPQFFAKTEIVLE